MRIVIHDFVGHPFQVQLSRELASRGHDILHLHFPGFETPKGRLRTEAGDPPNLAIEAIDIGHPYNKYSPVQRLMSDRRYVKICASKIIAFRADIVLSGNATPIAQNWLRSACQRAGIHFVAWIQDLYGMGVLSALKRKFGFAGELVGRAFEHLDESLIERSEGVVFISQEFHDVFRHLKPRSRGEWHVIENWAPIDELPLRGKVNPWSQEHGLDKKRVLLYSGTLGLKHNPELLVSLAQEFRSVGDVVVLVVSQGLGRGHLEKRKEELGLTNLQLLDFQPFSSLPDLIGTGDILLAIIEKEAGLFSVPSKVLTYLCASRPLLLSVPKENLAAQIVGRNQAGVVVEPDDVNGLIEAAKSLLDRPDYAAAFADRARAYALRTFQIADIATKFETVFNKSLQKPSAS